MLPLPIPLYRTAKKMEMTSLFLGPSQTSPSKKERAAGARDWIFLVVHTLNYMWGTGSVSALCWKVACEIRRSALDNLYAGCGLFAADTDGKLPSDWHEDFGRKAISYLGKQVATTEKLACIQVEPPLPAHVLAGRAPVVNSAGDFVPRFTYLTA